MQLSLVKNSIGQVKYVCRQALSNLGPMFIFHYFKNRDEK